MVGGPKPSSAVIGGSVQLNAAQRSGEVRCCAVNVDDPPGKRDGLAAVLFFFYIYNQIK